MSWIHVAWASKQVAGGGTNKLVLLMIADATSHDSPMLVCKIDRLAKLCELNEKTVRNALRDLEERGLIGTVLRFFEGQQISNGYFLMGDEWVEFAKERIRSENHRDGFSCKLKLDLEPPSGVSRTPFDGRPGGDAALGRAEMPGGAGGDAGQLLPSSLLPSSNTEFSMSKASAEAAEQQPERAAGISMQAADRTQAHPSRIAAPAQAPDAKRTPKQRTPSPSSARPPSPKIPSLEEFVDWASVSHPGWEREAEAWHKRMASQDWTTSTGKLVLNAKGTFNTWIANGWINKLTPQQELPRFGSFGHRE